MRHAPRAIVLGFGLGLAGVGLVEALLLAGLQPLAPVGWPGLAMLFATAFGGAWALAGGALVCLAYYAINLAAMDRFEQFYSHPFPTVSWIVGLAIMASAVLLARGRLLDAHRSAVKLASAQTELAVQKTYEAALRESEQRLRVVTDNLPGLVGYVDAAGHYRFNNPLYETWLGMPRAQIVGRTLREVWGEELYRQMQPHVERTLQGERVSHEYSVVRHGIERHILATYVPDLDPAGKVKGFFVLGADVTPLATARAQLLVEQERLEAAAQTDPLTGVANRARFADRAELAAARSRRNGTRLAVLYLDLDRFKEINDTRGHTAGDALLREFAARLRGSLRASDTVARLGGDEFVVLLEDLDAPRDAEHVAAKILAATRDSMHFDGTAIDVTVSIGLACGDGNIDPARLLLLADEALYEAKAAGRNTVRVAAPA